MLFWVPVLAPGKVRVPWSVEVRCAPVVLCWQTCLTQPSAICGRLLNYATTHRMVRCFWTRKSTSPCYTASHLDFLCNYNLAGNQNHHQKTERDSWSVMLCQEQESSSYKSEESCTPATSQMNLVKLLPTKWRFLCKASNIIPKTVFWAARGAVLLWDPVVELSLSHQNVSFTFCSS